MQYARSDRRGTAGQASSGTRSFPLSHRPLRFEGLEHRCLLSGVTLITHGFSSSVDGWVTQMAAAIAARGDLSVDQAIYKVEVTDPQATGTSPLSVVNSWRTGPDPTDPDTSLPEIAILLDWSAVAGTLTGGYTRSTVDVAAAVADVLVQEDFLLDLPTPVAELPFHLIGHSRGASLVGRLAHDLGERGVWVDQVTTLDPHPVDGIREPFLFNRDWGDAPMIATENVAFWDNYWRVDTGNSLDFRGEEVEDTHDNELVESRLADGGYVWPDGGEHSDVHLWYYGTIDTSTDPPANNGDEDVPNDWYDGSHPSRTDSGYALSRLVGGTRPAEGLSSHLGGTAERAAVSPTGLDWPDVLELKVDASELEFTVGDPIPLGYYYQDSDGDPTVTFFLDADKNPYNTPEHQAGQWLLSATGSSPQADAQGASTATAAAGAYFISARITDTDGHTRYTYTQDVVTILEPVPAEVVGRHVFYNNSTFDGNDPAAGAADDAAVATDKVPLLPGDTASFDNYTSYHRGINGIMVDVDGLPDAATLTAADFEFRMGNDDDPSGWGPAPAPLPDGITIRAGAGVGGSDRVTIRFGDGLIEKTWLEVTVKATAATGLAAPDVFYYGNAIGECGDSPDDAMVTSSDEIAARHHPQIFTPAAIDNPYDYDRDGKVTSVDQIVARHNVAALDSLQLITIPAPPPPAPILFDAALSPSESASRADADSFAQMAWLYDFEQFLVDRDTASSNADSDAVDKVLATL